MITNYSSSKEVNESVKSAKQEVKQESVKRLVTLLRDLFNDETTDVHNLFTAFGISKANEIHPTMFCEFFRDGCIFRPVSPAWCAKHPDDAADLPVFFDARTGQPRKMRAIPGSRVDSTINAYIDAVAYFVKNNLSEQLKAERERKKAEKLAARKAKKAAEKAATPAEPAEPATPADLRRKK